MSREEFQRIDGLSVIKLRDGRTGICPHWNDRGILVDAYRETDTEPEQILVPWEHVKDVSDGNGALVEVEGKREEFEG